MATALLMAVLNLVDGVAGLHLNGPHDPGQLAVRFLVVVARFVVIWFYVEGNHWARILVLVASAVAFWSLKYWAHAHAFLRLRIAVTISLGAFLIYFLNTAALRRYFDPGSPTIRPDRGW